MKPTDEQRKFIHEELIPAILADDGVFFAMSQWHSTFEQDDLRKTYYFDGVDRVVPRCGTVCCLGGWVEILKHPTEDPGYLDDRILGEHLGLSASETNGLFYGYQTDWIQHDELYGWPDEYRTRFAAAKTPFEKANVAAELLREVAEKGGDILGPWERD